MLRDLKRLQELFREGSPRLRNDYWTAELLETYALTLGERISWKWSSFLSDLYDLQIDPQRLFANASFAVEDWGCGPGTAALAYFSSVEPASFARHELFLSDRSAIAREFAAKRFLRPDLKLLSRFEEKSLGALHIRLVSYVLSELSDAQVAQLVSELRRTDLFMWVDSGAVTESRRLSQIRDQLRDEFYFLAPCPHQMECPVLKTKDEWCHRFATPPREIFHDPNWSRIAKDLFIDLRSLPYHSLYGVKKTRLPQLPPLPEKRPLGRPRIGKFEARIDSCTRAGEYVSEKITKRSDPERFKRLK